MAVDEDREQRPHHRLKVRNCHAETLVRFDDKGQLPLLVGKEKGRRRCGREAAAEAL
jgi:hypothetical protein